MGTARVEKLLEAIRELPRAERLRLVEHVVHDLAEEDRAKPHVGPIGLFADEPELVESICDEAMSARERDRLRASGD